MPKTKQTQKAKGKKRATNKQTQKVKGKKNNANQNNINIKIGDRNEKSSQPQVSGTSFGYPVYIQSPLMQQIAPSGGLAFGSAQPVATNPLSNPVSVIEPVKTYTREDYPQNSFTDDDDISTLTRYNAPPNSPAASIGGLTNPFEAIGQTLSNFGEDNSNHSIQTEKISSHVESAGLKNPHEEIVNTLVPRKKKFPSILNTDVSDTEPIPVKKEQLIPEQSDNEVNMPDKEKEIYAKLKRSENDFKATNFKNGAHGTKAQIISLLKKMDVNTIVFAKDANGKDVAKDAKGKNLNIEKLVMAFREKHNIN